MELRTSRSTRDELRGTNRNDCSCDETEEAVLVYSAMR